MFKYVLSLTFAVSFATAATISTSATCNGVTTLGTFDAFCSDGFGGLAQADLTAPSFVDTRIAPVSFVGFVVSAGSFGQVMRPSASANFSDDYVFTVFGGTGDGLFLPCFSGYSDGAGVSMSFGGIAFTPNGIFNNGNCIGNQPAPSSPAPGAARP